jgi:hypothetical protein
VDGLAGRKYDGLQGDALTKRALSGKYWPLDGRLLEAAERDYERRTRWSSQDQTTQPGKLPIDDQTFLRTRRVMADEMATAFRRELQKQGLLRESDNGQGFKVIVTKDATAIDVRHRSSLGQVVLVPHDNVQSDEDFGKDAIILVGHEIKGHACQAFNGRMLFGIWGGMLTEDDQTLYEGNAMNIENQCQLDYFGGAAEARPYPYVYPIAVDMAMRGASFREIFLDQRERFLRTEYWSPQGVLAPQRLDLTDAQWKKANYWGWRAALRVMRGHRDCSNPDSFAMAKDLGYERGLEIQRGLNAHGYGHYNHAAIIPGHEGLISLAMFDIRPEQLPRGERYVTDTDVTELLTQLRA